MRTSFASPVRDFTTGTNFTYRGYTALANSAMEQLQTVLNLGVLEIKFAQKLYYQIARPFVQCPPGFGIDIQSARLVPHRQRCRDAGSRHQLDCSRRQPWHQRVQHRSDPDHRA
jgi:hypothetical protein